MFGFVSNGGDTIISSLLGGESGCVKDLSFTRRANNVSVSDYVWAQSGIHSIPDILNETVMVKGFTTK